MNRKSRIRVLALCIFRRGDYIFVAEGYDALRKQQFFRPIGGGVEFGESAENALAREVMEEINAPVKDVRYIGMLENIFEYEGQPGHEICILFDGAFVESFRNADDYVVQGSDDDDVLYTARWMKVADFTLPESPPLYPDGLLELIARHT